MGTKAALKKFVYGPSFEETRFNRELVAALTAQKPEQAVLLSKALDRSGANENEENPTPTWHEIQSGTRPLAFDDLKTILKTLEAHDLKPDVSQLSGAKKLNKSPLSQAGFYDALNQHDDIAALMRQELEEMRAESKRKKGFIRTAFNVFAKEKPLEEILKNVTSFEKYCQENGITYNDVTGHLEQGEKPKATLAKIWDYRFLIAAVGGGAAGLTAQAAGVNFGALSGGEGAVASSVKFATQTVPTFFFGQALPYVVLPFISLSIFKAFSEKNPLKEVGTFARFGSLMGLGIAIGLGATTAASALGLLPSIDPSTIKDVVENAAGGGGSSASFNPSQYIMHGIVAFAAFAGLYQIAKNKNDNQSDEDLGQKGALRRLFNKASDIVVNKYTAPVIKAAGKITGKLSYDMDDIFNNYITWVGLPAIAAVVGGTLNAGGFGELAKYGGFYGTVAASMAGCAATMGGLSYFLYKCRGKEFKELFKTASTAFSISSSAATMPRTKEGLINMGVSEKTANAVVPLGANFNMMGTACYLGVVTACATQMLGMDPTLGQQAAAMGLAVLTAFGAPGAPASTIIFLDPVLAKAGLSQPQAQKIYELVLPPDRFFDMAQTALNVTGDQTVALDVERGPDWLKPFKKVLKGAFDQAKSLVKHENGQAPAVSTKDISGPKL